MKKLLPVIIILSAFFSSCKKEDPEEEARVYYKVVPASSNGITPNFKVTYTSSKNASSAKGGLTSTWKSETVYLKRGDFVSMTAEGLSSGVSYRLEVYLNSVLWQEKNMGAYGPVSISGNLPE